jgi:hypothetical protein
MPSSRSCVVSYSCQSFDIFSHIAKTRCAGRKNTRTLCTASERQLVPTARTTTPLYWMPAARQGRLLPLW